MGTKHNSSCLQRALNDEPIFVLLARDPSAPDAIRYWSTLREAMIGRGEKPLDDHHMLTEAATTAQDMVTWRAEATDPAQWPNGYRWTYKRDNLRFEDAVRKHVTAEYDAEDGKPDILLLELISSFADDSPVAVYAGTIRIALGHTAKMLANVVDRDGATAKRLTEMTTKFEVLRGGVIDATARLYELTRDVSDTRIRNRILKAVNVMRGVIGYEDIAETDAPFKPRTPMRDDGAGFVLDYEDWVRVKDDAMHIGNRFLVWEHGSHGLVYHENRNYATPEEVREDWTGFYPVAEGALGDMLRLLYANWKTKQFDITKPRDPVRDASLALAVLSNYRQGAGEFTTGDAGRVEDAINGLLDNGIVPLSFNIKHRFIVVDVARKIATGLRQVSGEMADYATAMRPDTSEAINGLVDRINGYALELADSGIDSDRLRGRPMRMSPLLGEPYGGDQHLMSLLRDRGGSLPEVQDPYMAFADKVREAMRDLPVDLGNGQRP